MKVQHYKGGLYEVLFPQVLHTESKEWLVVYRSLEKGHVYARPSDIFHGVVTLPDGTRVRRFTEVE